MFSKNMYLVLSCLPHNYSDITFQELSKRCKLSDRDIQACLAELMYSKETYIRTDGKNWYDCSLSLTDIGLAKVEAYEQEQKNMRLVKASLITAVLAMLASFASAVAAIVSLWCS